MLRGGQFTGSMWLAMVVVAAGLVLSSHGLVVGMGAGMNSCFTESVGFSVLCECCLSFTSVVAEGPSFSISADFSSFKASPLSSFFGVSDAGMEFSGNVKHRIQHHHKHVN